MQAAIPIRWSQPMPDCEWLTAHEGNLFLRLLQSTIKSCCEDVHEFLTADPKNVVALHCKAGKVIAHSISLLFLIDIPNRGELGSWYVRTWCMLGYTKIPHPLFGISEWREHTMEKESLFQAKWDTYTISNKPSALASKPSSRITYATSEWQQFLILMWFVLNYHFQSLFSFDVGRRLWSLFSGEASRQESDIWLKESKWRKSKTKRANHVKIIEVVQVKNFKKKDKLIDLDVSSHNVRVKGDIKLLFFDHDAMGSPDKVQHNS